MTSSNNLTELFTDIILTNPIEFVVNSKTQGTVLYFSSQWPYAVYPDAVTESEIVIYQDTWRFRCGPRLMAFNSIFLIPPLGVVTGLVCAALIIAYGLPKYLTIESQARNQDQQLARAKTELSTAALDASVILGAIKDPLLIFDPNGHLKHANESALTMLQYARQEAPPFYEILQFPADTVLPSTDNKVHDVLMRRKDGTTFEAEATVSTEYQESRERRLTKGHKPKTVPRLVLFRDVTAKKHAQRQLKEATVEAEQSNMVQNNLITFLAHELRNPLHVVWRLHICT